MIKIIEDAYKANQYHICSQDMDINKKDIIYKIWAQHDSPIPKQGWFLRVKDNQHDIFIDINIVVCPYCGEDLGYNKKYQYN